MSPLSVWFTSEASRRSRLLTAMALLCLFGILGALYVGNHAALWDRWQKRSTIIQLRDLPPGQMTVRGVVTYVDRVNKRFWVQDSTGAIAVKQDPAVAGVYFSEAVVVAMKKTHAYDPATGYSSLGLSDFKVTRSRIHSPLPLPVETAIPTLSEEAKNGIRVTVDGVVQGASSKGNGIVEVDLGDEGKEVQTLVPGDPQHFMQWLDARVRVTGVLEVLLDENGSPASEFIWAQNAAVEKIAGASASPPLSTIRSLYVNSKHITAHMVRLRGRVLYQESPDLLLIEDEWGAVGCAMAEPGDFAPGTPIEAAGFLKTSGLRLTIVHTAVTRVVPAEQPESAPNRVVTTIAGIRALDENAIATAPPVRVTGVVTYVNTIFRQLFVQDATAGIFTKYSGDAATLSQGDKVTVVGIAGEGDFAPVILAPKFIHRGRAPLPKPIAMTRRSRFGELDSLYAEIEGVVHPLRGGHGPSQQTNFNLYSSLGPVHVGVMQHPAWDKFKADIQDATVRVRGVAGEVFNSRKQLVGLQLAVSDMSGITIVDPSSSDPFSKPATPISNLLKFSPHARPDHLVVVSGTVTMLGNGFFYLQDHTGGVRVDSDTSSLHLQDGVDAAGYAAATGYSPALTDAAVKDNGRFPAVKAQPVTADLMSDGRFDSQLVSIEARLLNVENSTGTWTLTVSSGGRIFKAIYYPIDAGQPFIVPEEGSLLRLSGICSVEVGRGDTDNLLRKDAVEFRLMIPSPSNIQVLKGGSWWTLRHSLVLVGVLILAVLLSAGRIVVLLRRLAGQNEELRRASEKESAVRQLIGAMHEVRVEKRFTSRVSVPEADELALLGTEFNHMIEELHVRDIAMAEAEAKLQQQALSDALTGLPNRRLLSDRLSQSIAAAKRDGSMVAVLYIDLDGFKLVNDSFGHNFGDALLIRVAERIASRIRKSDTLSRLGGDEFVVLLNRLTAVEHAELLAHLLLQVIAKPFEIDGHEITIGASIGICVFPKQANNDSELLQFADSAMYSAKRSGKNRVVMFKKELGESVRERLLIENQLRRAVEEGEIAVHYQPEFEISSGGLVRFEALARWKHPTLGNIPPSKFIPIAEENGLIIPLGAHVMERACADCVSWQTNSETPIEVAVNVSNVQIGRESFVDEVKAILKRTGLQPELLQIELTESVMLIGVENAAATIRQLQSIGVTVAIDDFGTGYSALSYIQKLPFNALKIDRTFMIEIMQRAETKAMVHSLVLLAQELGMNVIVEGVETEAQLTAIKAMGADEVQGYLLGRPTPDPMEHLLHRPHKKGMNDMDDREFLAPEKLKL